MKGICPRNFELESSFIWCSTMIHIIRSFMKHCLPSISKYLLVPVQFGRLEN